MLREAKPKKQTSCQAPTPGIIRHSMRNRSDTDGKSPLLTTADQQDGAGLKPCPVLQTTDCSSDCV